MFLVPAEGRSVASKISVVKTPYVCRRQTLIFMQLWRVPRRVPNLRAQFPSKHHHASESPSPLFVKDPCQRESGQCQLLRLIVVADGAIFIEAEDRAVRSHREIAVGAGAGFQHSCHGPALSLVVAEFDGEVSSLAAIWVVRIRKQDGRRSLSGCFASLMMLPMQTGSGSARSRR